MKKYLLLCLVLFSSLALSAQNYVSFITEVPFGETITYDTIDIEFVKVVSDSRCPISVTCVRAGEAKVEVNIYKDGRFLSKKEIIISASGVINQKTQLLYSTEEVRIIGTALYPYPQTPDKISSKDYYLELKIN